MLLLRISSGAAATMLQLKTPLILERVNGFFGYKAIDKIQAVQGPLPRARKAPEPLKIAADKPENISEALERLGAAVQRRTAPDVDKTLRSNSVFPPSLSQP
jgi:hypothetical protein